MRVAVLSDIHGNLPALAAVLADVWQAGPDLIGEASGKGVLRELHRKYSPEAYEAMIEPILQEIGRNKPIRSGRPPVGHGNDPLTAPVWPPAPAR